MYIVRRGFLAQSGRCQSARCLARNWWRHTSSNTQSTKDEEDTPWPRRVFSGIQPTGAIHLGNYLGAVRKWVELQNKGENLTICIVDLHAITLPQNPDLLRHNILKMAATLLGCGIDPEKTNLFVQSSVKEHSELCWILNCHTTMARLAHLPQYKEKMRTVKDVPLGLYVYPVLQAADIMLYKSTHVPVGEDQIQHIQLAQHLARTFNTKYGKTFPICQAIIEEQHAARIRSLRNPSKKMSKSDGDPKSVINLTDSPDVILEKVKKAVTDFNSDVTYDPEKRLGVSNLIAIHGLVTGRTIQNIVDDSRDLDTGKYKLRVADSLVEHLKPIREKIKDHLAKRQELVYLLECGAAKAREIAQATLEDVKEKVGLGERTIYLHKEELNWDDDEQLAVESVAYRAATMPQDMAEAARAGLKPRMLAHLAKNAAALNVPEEAAAEIIAELGPKAQAALKPLLLKRAQMPPRPVAPVWSIEKMQSVKPAGPLQSAVRMQGQLSPDNFRAQIQAKHSENIAPPEQDTIAAQAERTWKAPALSANTAAHKIAAAPHSTQAPALNESLESSTSTPASSAAPAVPSQTENSSTVDLGQSMNNANASAAPTATNTTQLKANEQSQILPENTHLEAQVVADKLELAEQLLCMTQQAEAKVDAADAVAAAPAYNENAAEAMNSNAAETQFTSDKKTSDITGDLLKEQPHKLTHPDELPRKMQEALPPAASWLEKNKQN